MKRHIPKFFIINTVRFRPGIVLEQYTLHVLYNQWARADWTEYRMPYKATPSPMVQGNLSRNFKTVCIQHTQKIVTRTIICIVYQRSRHFFSRNGPFSIKKGVHSKPAPTTGLMCFILCITITDVTFCKNIYARLGGAISSCGGIISARTTALASVAEHIEGGTMSPSAPARALPKGVKNGTRWSLSYLYQHYVCQFTNCHLLQTAKMQLFNPVSATLCLVARAVIG